MKSSYKSPEAWKAQVLHDEIIQLQIATRSLEFQYGFHNGLQAGRWESAESNVDAPLAASEVEARGRREPVVAADSGA